MGFDLSALVTNPQKRLMLRGKTWALVSEKVGPLVGYFGEVRICARSERRDDFRQRIAKVFGISDAETRSITIWLRNRLASVYMATSEAHSSGERSGAVTA